MWLINTSTGRLKWFNDPSQVRYAILSHVWGEREQTFQELQAFMRDHRSPRYRTTDKIRKCCIYAEREEYEWLWVDAGCINKESSAELSEAINSMFAWYAQAGVCYALLDDVREDEDPRARGSSFWKSRWWTRGWTLQELVVPKHLIFLAESWVSIGTKLTLADEVERISGVDRGILLGKLSLDEISVARRMSWASRRRTTRVEDRAYSLLGIFGVHLPTIYGEGGNAFIRLQEEIIKKIPDQSIFAWGPVLYDFPSSCEGFRRNESRKYPEMESLLAPSPDVFVTAAGFFPIPFERLGRATHLQLENPTYSFTSYGCHVEFPVICCTIVPHLNLLSSQETVHIALLACADSSDNRPLALLLRIKPMSWNDYYVGRYCSVSPNRRAGYHRVVSLMESFDHLEGLAIVRKLYIDTSSDSLRLQRSREGARGLFVRVCYLRRNLILYARARWRNVTYMAQSLSVLGFISAAFLPITVQAFSTSAKASRSGQAFLWIAFMIFESWQLSIYLVSVGRRPLPWLRLQSIPALVTLRLLNAPWHNYLLYWAVGHLVDLYFLFMPATVLLGVHYCGW